MSLIKCPGCNSYISELENNCPNCGFIITEELVEQVRSKQQQEQEHKLVHKKQYAGMSSWIAYR